MRYDSGECLVEWHPFTALAQVDAANECASQDYPPELLLPSECIEDERDCCLEYVECSVGPSFFGGNHPVKTSKCDAGQERQCWFHNSLAPKSFAAAVRGSSYYSAFYEKHKAKRGWAPDGQCLSTPEASGSEGVRGRSAEKAGATDASAAAATAAAGGAPADSSPELRNAIGFRGAQLGTLVGGVRVGAFGADVVGNVPARDGRARELVASSEDALLWHMQVLITRLVGVCCVFGASSEISFGVSDGAQVIGILKGAADSVYLYEGGWGEARFDPYQ
ncbi:hypothetical protein T492DRAFT_839265 [Pavlovales sp. CCMP2436]|nr:hypothetical protein T492DRAFT_839265 [Pavlovales sp. CCMP2436]